MQLVSIRKQLGLGLIIALSTSSIAPSMAYALSPKTNKVIGWTIFATVMISFLRLVTKKTQPKRVMPESDSIADTAWFAFDELLVGQIEKGDRASKVIINPEHPEELTIEYSKIEARGLTGITYSKMKPVIIPALTLMLLFKKDIKDQLNDTSLETKAFIADPYGYVADLFDIIANPKAE